MDVEVVGGVIGLSRPGDPILLLSLPTLTPHAPIMTNRHDMKRQPEKAQDTQDGSWNCAT